MNGGVLRSIGPIPGAPWPHDMLTLVDVHSHLMTLVFVREEWTERWAQQWQRAWEWFEIADMRSILHEPELLYSDLTLTTES